MYHTFMLLHYLVLTSVFVTEAAFLILHVALFAFFSTLRTRGLSKQGNTVAEESLASPNIFQGVPNWETFVPET